VRARYDGRKRSPFNEAECGHHYARAMASWTAVLALTGFQYSGVRREMEFKAARRPVTWFWSNGSAWGTCRQRPGRAATQVELRVLHGRLPLRTIRLAGFGSVSLPGDRALRGVLRVTVRRQPAA
jgi:hypothetical protein